MIKWKGKDFDNNPNDMSTSVQYVGKIYMEDGKCEYDWKYSENYIVVYGISQNQIVEIANKFKEIEPAAKKIVLYGAENYWGSRKEMNTINI